MKKQGVLFTVLSGVLFGIVPLIVTIAYNSEYDALSVGFYRNLFAVPFLWLFCKINRIDLRVEKSDISKILLIGIFGMSATSLFLNISYIYLPVGLATTLHFIYPTFVTVIGIVLFKEKIIIGKIICLLLSFLGMMLIINLSNSANILGVCIAVLSGFTYAVYIVSIDRTKLMTKYNPFAITFYLCVIGTIFFFSCSVVFGSFKIPHSISEVVTLSSIALFCQVLAIVFLQLGIKFIGPSNAAIFSVLEPLISNLMGFIFLNETLTYQKGIGCFMILLSVMIMSRLTLKKEE